MFPALSQYRGEMVMIFTNSDSLWRDWHSPCARREPATGLISCVQQGQGRRKVYTQPGGQRESLAGRPKMVSNTRGDLLAV